MNEIEILEVIDTGYSIAVEYRFDFGFEGRMNFNLDVTEEQIIETLKRKYKRMKRAQQSRGSRESLRTSLTGRRINVR